MRHGDLSRADMNSDSSLLEVGDLEEAFNLSELLFPPLEKGNNGTNLPGPWRG